MNNEIYFEEFHETVVVEVNIIFSKKMYLYLSHLSSSCFRTNSIGCTEKF
jgi:hypothetical protein